MNNNIVYWKLMLECIKKGGANVQVPLNVPKTTKEALLRNLLIAFKNRF